MAVRHRLIKVSPQTVWDVLADGTRYAEWVVGTSASEPVRGQWPQVGSAIAYEIRVGPWRLSNETVVRYCDEGSELGLEARAGVLGTARISVELRPWGPYCLVIADEHPLQGMGGQLHNVGVEALIQLRHRTMLARLARLCEAEGTPQRESPEEAEAERPRKPRGVAAHRTAGGHG
ncbi:MULTISPECIES: SRPBCC family protein [unclassified Streptomyces]|uniref:SRPBCC family protein n=1 Tax=unclassified Streptomyces TaxID=2593676 RepID=UPI002E795605|nr:MULTISPECIES: SRPBCC family protein [unclassified Streptomyces]MEE1760209.1 SRPBCC family protein [Streptomyces sp. SP18BB07]MEE1836302.1 SRPBCC family protein [Streptomyces sp. SP17KL33]